SPEGKGKERLHVRAFKDADGAYLIELYRPKDSRSSSTPGYEQVGPLPTEQAMEFLGCKDPMVESPIHPKRDPGVAAAPAPAPAAAPFDPKLTPMALAVDPARAAH